ncbi:hypothetical protein J0B03_05940 [Alkalibacter rhizosphaerae]|uniref:Polysaccharide deacetylase n=1 Tax=Alkalibacter rhizosphaerae TaxID=2815577 RepID=A0A974XGS6_9FIRM|nr:hypothetical protein [Alkalibacter rhizosphaerae]QSX09597.1 hypothetical protein J0B03_05940 [Alkalibacter rhizosphaerae]
MDWPSGKDFAFTIIDDTDAGTLENTKPVYDLLCKKDFRTTKTVWAYPGRDGFEGASLNEKSYASFIVELHRKGFEIASHGPGSGDFTREEILRSFQIIENLVGEQPRIFINHAFNKENLYWGTKRFNSPVAEIFWLMKRIQREKLVPSLGNDPESLYFWGDYAKEHVDYIRNHVFTGLDTMRQDPFFPYRERNKDLCSNYWFSSSDGYDRESFNRLLHPDKVDQLVRAHGCAIVYTHFGYGFVTENGLDPVFRERIEYLSSLNGWFVPACRILDYMKGQKKGDHYLNWQNKLELDMKWLSQRVFRKVFWRV